MKSAYDRAAAYAPSKTGANASGTWGISITGSSATATTATNCSRTITAGTGLTGGGALTANRTLNIDSTVLVTNAAKTVSNILTFSSASTSSSTSSGAGVVCSNNTSGRWAMALTGQAGYWAKSIYWKLSSDPGDDINSNSTTAPGTFGWNRSSQYASLVYSTSDQSGGMMRFHRNGNNGATISGYRASSTALGYVELRQDGMRFNNVSTVANVKAEVAPTISTMTTNVIDKIKLLTIQDHAFAQSGSDAAFTAHHFNMTTLKAQFPTMFRAAGGHAIGNLVNTETGETIDSGCESPAQSILDDGHTWTQTGTAATHDYYCREDLIPFLVKAIQELNTRLEALEP